MDAETDAKIRKLNAETDAIYITRGVVDIDEVKDARFGQFGMTDETKLSGDSLDLPQEYIEQLDDSIYRSIYKSFLQNRGDG